MWMLTGLMALHLSGNPLRSVPAAIGDLSRLTYLGLVNSQLDSVPNEIGLLTALEYLDIGKNLFTTLPAGIGGMTALILLDVSHGTLTDMPAELGQLGSLVFLMLYGNELRSPPTALPLLTNLSVLDLGWNMLDSFPPLASLSRLEYLHLQSNRLSAVPANVFDGLHHLRVLSLGNNDLSGNVVEVGDFMQSGSVGHNAIIVLQVACGDRNMPQHATPRLS